MQKKSLLVAIAVCLLSACTTPPKLTAEDEEYLRGFRQREALRKSQETPTIGVNLMCIRHAGPHGDLMPYVQGFWVEEVPYGQMSIGMRGGDVNCGGSLAGAYTIPRTWRPGMKVKVKWHTWGRPGWSEIKLPVEEDPTIAPGTPIANWNGTKGALHEYTTTIPYYEKPGSAYVHLFRNGQARVVISDAPPSDFFGKNNDHPILRESLEPPPEVE